MDPEDDGDIRMRGDVRHRAANPFETPVNAPSAVPGHQDQPPARRKSEVRPQPGQTRGKLLRRADRRGRFEDYGIARDRTGAIASAAWSM
jgi:hypothetical protein